MAGYENCEFADEWRDERRAWLSETIAVPGNPETYLRTLHAPAHL
jgi:hypothetical protein